MCREGNGVIWGRGRRTRREASFPERRINIDRSRSNPRLSKIEGPKHQGPDLGYQICQTTPFLGTVLFPASPHIRHHGINEAHHFVMLGICALLQQVPRIPWAVLSQ